jgi:formamidopyrimidine-DNA glycosylase
VPELPDVEGFRRELARSLPGRRVRRVDVRDAGVLRNTTPRTLSRNLVDHKFGKPRRHGKWLIPTSVMGIQGPDALDLDLRGFRKALQGRRGRLKPTLMDQAVIAGLGNLLVDEICWQARLHPTRPVASLDDDELRRLHAIMKRVLRTSVRHARVPGLPRWLTGARDEPDPSCPRCGSRLSRGRTGGRTSMWCPRCQRN